MNLEKTIERLDGVLADLQEVARDLGHELPRGRMEILTQFRAACAHQIAKQWKSKEGTLIYLQMAYQHYLQALADVTAAFQASPIAELLSMIDSFSLDPSGHVRIEKRGQGAWAVVSSGVLNTSGEWEYEPSPSNRDDEFIARTRYPSIEAALGAYRNWREKNA